MVGRGGRAPIFRFNEQRANLVASVVDQVTGDCADPHGALSDAVYHEIKRLTASGAPSEALRRWRGLAKRLGSMAQGEQRGELRRLCEEYAWDVAGNFDPRVYGVASRLAPPLLGTLIAPQATLTSVRRLLDASALSDRITIDGEVNAVRNLVSQGTLIYVPTHFSNMDSIVFGYALERAGLPPATYGAGKNLFTNPVLSYFMHNLGAYRIDRRLRHYIYKDVLKEYSTQLLERGFHSLFFPGGTRSRSGGIERKLKLGLAGTAMAAFQRSAKAHPKSPQRVFFVPATISYLVTLEAETLISDFLQAEGKSRFIIEDDESSRLAKIAMFAEKLLRHDGGVQIRFGKPLDPLGNLVAEDGQSIDGAGHRVDPTSYLQNHAGEVVDDPQRDAEYTRELGLSICRAYAENNVILDTNVVAAALFNRLRSSSGSQDLFALIRIRHKAAVSRADLEADVGKLRDKLVEMHDAGKLRVGAGLRKSPGEIVAEALRAFKGTHSTPVVVEHADGLAIGDGPLAFYYQNRLAPYGLVLDAIAPKRKSR